MAMTHETGHAATHHPEEHAHPGPRKYVGVAVILAAFTAFEVILSYAGLPDGLTIALMIGVAIIKFAMVAMWFMHLRFDNRLFTIMFAGGLALALIVFIAVLTIQRTLFV